MPLLIDVVTASPPYELEQPTAEAFAREMFGALRGDIERLLPIFANTGIRTRRLCQPVSWYREDHTLSERNAIYVDAASELCARAGRELLERRGLRPEQIDRVIYINTTGIATPSIDARLIQMLQLSRNVRRTPIWGLGCAGGAAGLAHGFHHLVGHPRERVLLFAAEMCSLTLLRDDPSTANVVATALFADGAAAALLSGDDTGDKGLRLIDARSTIYPDSLHLMGWNVVSRGLQVVFDRRIPKIIEVHARAELDAFLRDHGLERSELTEYLFHPGGRKVLEAYALAFEVELGRFRWSREVLRDFGNMSSVTLLYVLERYLREHPLSRQGHAAISALGPGFSSETLLMEV
jgi:alkylresorcinol/alkylpyrone synthase